MLWLPPKVWFQGSQSISTGGSCARKAKVCAICCRLAQSMRCVLTTPLGSLVEPEVNRNLAIVSGPTARCAAAASGPASVASRSAKVSCARPGSAPCASNTGVSTATQAPIAAA